MRELQSQQKPVRDKSQTFRVRTSRLLFILSRLIAIGVFNSLAIVGAAVAMGLSGTIASYIMENKDDPDNEICHPEQVYPPIYTNVGKDCKFVFKLNSFIHLSSSLSCLGVIWATLEYTLMSYSIAEAIVNALQLVLVLVAVLVPKRSGIMC